MGKGTGGAGRPAMTMAGPDAGSETVSSVDDRTVDPLGAWGIEPRSAEPVSGGFRALNWDVRSPSDERLFLKRYRASDPDAVAETHRFERRFAEAGIPTVPLLPTPDGPTVASSDGVWSLSPFVEGRVLGKEDLRADHGREIGAMLGRIHRAGADMPRPERASAASVDRDRVRAKFTELLALAEAGDEPFDRLATEALRYKLELGRTYAPPEPVDPATAPIVHGDYQEANLFFDADDRISHVLDWERVGPGDPRVELARAVLFVGLDDRLRDPRGVGAAIVAGYRETAPLSRADLHEGFELFFRKQVHNAWVEEFHYREGARSSDEFLTFNFALLKTLSDRRGEIADRLFDA